MILTLKKRNSFTHKRFIVSIITFAFITSTLVVGSAGSLMQQASARENNRNENYSNQGRNDRNENNNRSGSSSSRDNNQNNNNSSASSQKQAPQTTKKQSPRTTHVSHSTSASPSTPQITPTSAITREAPPVPVDTAADSSNMTATQAALSSNGQSVAYNTSQRISIDTRNRLMVVATVATATGALLFTMSYVGAFSPSRRSIPVRYISSVGGGSY